MSNSDYGAHAARLNTAARSAHEKWIESLTPDQRANLRRLGVLDPADDSHEVGGHSPTQLADVAESHLARTEIDLAAELDGHAGPIADRFDIPLHVAREILDWHVAGVEASMRTHEADLLSIVVGGLLASNNIKIAAAGLAFAGGMEAANGLGSQAQYARKLGVSRTILSKAVRSWAEQLNLRTNVWQKTPEACATYSAVAKARHWRKAKVSATELFKRINTLRKKS